MYYKTKVMYDITVLCLTVCCLCDNYADIPVICRRLLDLSFG